MAFPQALHAVCDSFIVFKASLKSSFPLVKKQITLVFSDLSLVFWHPEKSSFARVGKQITLVPRDSSIPKKV